MRGGGASGLPPKAALAGRGCRPAVVSALAIADPGALSPQNRMVGGVGGEHRGGRHVDGARRSRRIQRHQRHQLLVLVLTGKFSELHPQSLPPWALAVAPLSFALPPPLLGGPAAALLGEMDRAGPRERVECRCSVGICPGRRRPPIGRSYAGLDHGRQKREPGLELFVAIDDPVPIIPVIAASGHPPCNPRTALQRLLHRRDQRGGVEVFVEDDGGGRPEHQPGVGRCDPPPYSRCPTRSVAAA